jgi:hypothetical protein
MCEVYGLGFKSHRVPSFFSVTDPLIPVAIKVGIFSPEFVVPVTISVLVKPWQSSSIPFRFFSTRIQVPWSLYAHCAGSPGSNGLAGFL